jgi:hypothetical protein
MEKTKLEQLVDLIVSLKSYIRSSESIISLQDKLIKELTQDLEKSKLNNKKQFAYGMYVAIGAFILTQIIFNLLIK